MRDWEKFRERKYTFEILVKSYTFVMSEFFFFRNFTEQKLNFVYLTVTWFLKQQ